MTMRKSAARFAVVPLIGLALTGLTACEKSDKKASADASSSASAPGAGAGSSTTGSTAKPTQTGAAPGAGKTGQPGGDQLAKLLLSDSELPSGLSAGSTSTDKSPARQEKTADPNCQQLVSHNVSKAATGHAEREYQNAKSSSTLSGAAVNLDSQSHPFLMQEFQAELAALKRCQTVDVTDDGKASIYTFSDVRPDRFGPDTVAFRVQTVDSDTTLYMYVVLAVRGTVAVSMSTYTTEAAPAEPVQFAQAQIAKVEAALK
ncbi:hypothetical protein [Yinghuangia seranimata]|uniref:hypothetical protein n=1 Tax=Yinghuangia seranimata TaxID=408067 RepID=UPI00248C2C14|nr:hypothetical protein [Yinghuangia seranimata]MDI2132924.1 hypothetical protein [Yinghuangia seranimata]